MKTKNKKTIEMMVREDAELLAPFVIREMGELPPMVLFHFDSIDEELQLLLNTTVKEEVIHVDNGFFFALTREKQMENMKDFMRTMGVFAAVLERIGLAKTLRGVTFSAVGEGTKVDAKTHKKLGEDEMFIVDGQLLEDGNRDVIMKSLKMETTGRGKNKKIVYSLEDSKLFDKGEVNMKTAGKFDPIDDLCDSYTMMKKEFKRGSDTEFMEHLKSTCKADLENFIGSFLTAIDAHMSLKSAGVSYNQLMGKNGPTPLS